jgi:hypothetical protein
MSFWEVCLRPMNPSRTAQTGPARYVVVDAPNGRDAEIIAEGRNPNCIVQGSATTAQGPERDAGPLGHD